jgi:S-methylmethionine-dependent homocysteine/selenocysteine methylase
MAGGADRSWGWVTDGGIETDLMFHHGLELPEFAAYPLVRTIEGRAALRAYYEEYAAIAEADEVAALTLTDTREALGVVRAADAAGIPAVISFTVETDGRLADGTSLEDAVLTVDGIEGAAPPAYFMVNCAHPRHILPAVERAGAWKQRVRGVRSNASTQSHAELDEAETLDEGDLGVLVPAHRQLERQLPALDVVGGCCGTDARHVAALWGAPAPRG